ncbi:MAG: zinc ribbon domain-containing protein [Firmicutes bacterium]|nr:zinc ribbon domain-containing protein [Bacillota bacterium]
MKYCKRCGSSLLNYERFCSNCGAPWEPAPKPVFPWRVTAIIFLALFIIAGIVYLLYEHYGHLIGQSIQPPSTYGLAESEDPLLGKYFGEKLVDSWEYPGGMIDEYAAYDESGNFMTIYRAGPYKVFGFRFRRPASIILPCNRPKILLYSTRRRSPSTTTRI